MSLDIVRAAALDGVPHGFFGRRGGFSTGQVAGLNCGTGSGDDPQIVEANRRIAADAILPGAPLASVYQIHSPTAVIVTEAVPYAERPQADALVSDRPGLLLGVVTADCAPILLADREAGVVAAAHAGWRGATGRGYRPGDRGDDLARRQGRADRCCDRSLSSPRPVTRSAMLSPNGCSPTIRTMSASLAKDPAASRISTSKPMSSPGWPRREFARIEASGLDTYALEDRFYSYRRATHRNEPAYGRQLSLIGLAS